MQGRRLLKDNNIILIREIVYTEGFNIDIISKRL